VYSRIADGLRLSREQTTSEDLRRERKLRHLLTAVTFMLAASLIAVAFQWHGAAIARDAERQRTEELSEVTAFQSSMIEGLDSESMGIRLSQHLRSRFRSSIGRRSPEGSESEELLASLEAVLSRVNMTDVALAMLRENILDVAVEAIARDFRGQPLVRASLLQTISTSYRELGFYDDAMPLQTEALASRRNELGNGNKDTMDSIHSMGVLLYLRGNLEGAEPLYREALGGRRNALGPSHPDTLTSMNDLGVLLMAKGALDEAERCFVEALRGRRRTLGAGHADSLESLSNLAQLYHWRGDRREAERYYRDALDGYRRGFGDGDRRAIIVVNNLAALLGESERLAEAEQLYREFVPKLQMTLGNDHPESLILEFQWGRVIGALGNAKVAEDRCTRSYEGLRRVLGSNHRHTIAALCDLGMVLHGQGRLGDAETRFLEAFSEYRCVLGDGHPDTLRALGNLVITRMELGEFAEAEAELLNTRRRLLLDDGGHGDAEATVVKLLAMLHDKWSASEPAGAHDKQAADWRAKLVGTDADQGLGERE